MELKKTGGTGDEEADSRRIWERRRARLEGVSRVNFDMSCCEK
jgi:hypothetical protein